MYLNILFMACCGRNHTLTLDDNGDVWIIGKREVTQRKVNEDCKIPKKISGLVNIVKIACGFNHSICINTNGNVFSFGSNEHGQLGIGPTFYTLRPMQVKSIINIVNVICGTNCTFFINESKEVFVCGSNNKQLGVEPNIKEFSIKVPMKVEGVSNVIDIASDGVRSTLFLQENGNVYGTGKFDSTLDEKYIESTSDNEYKHIFKLGFSNMVSIKCTRTTFFLLNNEGELFGFGRNYAGELGTGSKLPQVVPVKVPTLEGISVQKISCGIDTLMVLYENQELWMSGSNMRGQLGSKIRGNEFTLKKTFDNVQTISSGGYHTLIKSDSKLYGFGYSTFGQLGYIQRGKMPTLSGIIEFPEEYSNIARDENINSRAKSARK